MSYCGEWVVGKSFLMLQMKIRDDTNLEAKFYSNEKSKDYKDVVKEGGTSLVGCFLPETIVCVTVI